MEIVTGNILDNKSAFELFFKENYDSLCRFAVTYTKDPNDAEEVVQNSFVKLWENRSSIELGSSPKAYLFSMIRNACLNQIKHISIREEYKQYNEQFTQQNAEIEEQIDANTLKEKINVAIHNMPPQRKRIFEMSRFEGLKYKEIAAHLDISIKTVENHMGSAMKYLRVELKDYLHLAVIIYLIEGLGDKLLSVVYLLEL